MIIDRTNQNEYITRRLTGPFSQDVIKVFSSPSPPSPSPDTVRFAIVDVETTGLDVTQCEIIEIGVLFFDFVLTKDNRISVTEFSGYQSFEEPENPIPQEVTEVNGITNEQVAGCRIDWEHVQTMLNSSDLVIAHNASYDAKVLSRYFNMDCSWACSLVDIDWKAKGAICNRLEGLLLEHGYFYTAHRALDDCVATAFLISEKWQENADPYLVEMSVSATKEHVRIYATGSPFHAKDLLKNRGYKWDADRKVWWTEIAGSIEDSSFKDEVMFLKENCGVSRPESIELTAKNRFLV
jgi:DNA polymerase III subunit epsilon